jgi:hypothetical protein
MPGSPTDAITYQIKLALTVARCCALSSIHCCWCLKLRLFAPSALSSSLRFAPLLYTSSTAGNTCEIYTAGTTKPRIVQHRGRSRVHCYTGRLGQCRRKLPDLRSPCCTLLLKDA